MIDKDWQSNIGRGQGTRGYHIGSVVFITLPVKDKDGNVIRKGWADEISWEEYIKLRRED